MNLKNIGTIMRKEFYRVFKDRRLLFTSILMPGLLIFVMYTFMGTAMRNAYTTDDDYDYQVFGISTPAEISAMLEQAGIRVKDLATASDAEETKRQVSSQECDLLMVFPESFMSDVKAYDLSGGSPAPNVELYYNSAKTESYDAYHIAVNVLDAYENSMINKFDINRQDEPELSYDLATQEDNYQQILSMLMPMLIMMFMFSGSMQIAPESIAGEKERGTIATILVTPVKRTELALGKILALSIISMLSGLSSFIGIIFSLPSLIGEESGDVASLFSVKDYALLLLIMLSTVLVIVSLMSVLSAFAKTIKEATAYLTPLMLVVIGVSLSGLFTGGSGAGGSMKYMIPVLNSSQCFTDFFSFDYEVSGILITVGANIIFSVIVTLGLSKMLNSEKIIFAK